MSKGDYQQDDTRKRGFAYPTSEDQQLAKFLKDMASDYLKEKCPLSSVTEAVQEWTNFIERKKAMGKKGKDYE